MKIWTWGKSQIASRIKWEDVREIWNLNYIIFIIINNNTNEDNQNIPQLLSDGNGTLRQNATAN